MHRITEPEKYTPRQLEYIAITEEKPTPACHGVDIPQGPICRDILSVNQWQDGSRVLMVEQDGVDAEVLTRNKRSIHDEMALFRLTSTCEMGQEAYHLSESLPTYTV